jgi:hypothetical protein
MNPAGHQRANSRKKTFFNTLLAAGCCLLLCSCASQSPPLPVPVTQIDPAQATPDYWLNQPAITGIESKDFDLLWKTCRMVMHDRFFVIDREDFREGLMTSLPLVSKQYWEFWRRDTVTVSDIADNSMATIRRTIYFDFSQNPDGSYVAEPKVLVERFATVERRLTAITEYHTAFSGPRPFGSAENDQGLSYPTDYWYATGRDTPLERDLADTIERKLGS